MSWLSRLVSRFRNERTFVMPPPQWGARQLPTFDAGMPLTVDEALRVSVVWACMDTLVRSMAPRPWNVFDIGSDGKREVRIDEPLSYLLNTRPNPQMTAIGLREAMQYSALAWGNGYAEIVTNGRGEPAELWPIEPDRCMPWRNEETQEVGYRLYQYNGGVVWVPGKKIFHLRGPASTNGLTGDNLLVRASRAIAIAASAQQFSASFLANGTVLAGVIEMEAKILDKAVVDNLGQQFAERYAGPHNTGKPMILHGGAKWKEIQADPNKSQLLDTRKFQVPEIARYFGVPLQKIQVVEGAHGYGTNIEQLGIEFVRDTLRPWAERFEQEADFKLIPARALRRETHIDLSELTLGDFKSQVEAAGIAVEKGLLTLNEARERFGWNHIGPDGDVHFLPSTAKTVEQIITPPEPPTPKALPAAGTGDGAATVNRAVALSFAQAFDRYARAMKNRRADLERNPETAAEKMEAAREQLRARLAEDCADAVAMLGAAVDLAAYAGAVEEGEPPRLAAARLVEGVNASHRTRTMVNA